MKHYVIVGNGTAAAGCIEGIRSRDPSGTVTVISEERHPVYCRPLISYLLDTAAGIFTTTWAVRSCTDGKRFIFIRKKNRSGWTTGPLFLTASCAWRQVLLRSSRLLKDWSRSGTHIPS